MCAVQGVIQLDRIGRALSLLAGQPLLEVNQLCLPSWLCVRASLGRFNFHFDLVALDLGFGLKFGDSCAQRFVDRDFSA